MLKVGLTGGIASGKTTVTALFGELGVPHVDADIISRKLLSGSLKDLSPQSSPTALHQVKQQFGEHVFNSQGELDRQKLRDIIFSDSQQRYRLEDIMHPLIDQEMTRQLTKLSTDYALLVIPLLVEKNKMAQVDRVLVVDAPESVQLQRLQQRDNCSLEQAKNILAAQSSREARLTAADDIIENTGTSAHLKERVLQLHQFYLDLAQQ